MSRQQSTHPSKHIAWRDWFREMEATIQRQADAAVASIRMTAQALIQLNRAIAYDHDIKTIDARRIFTAEELGSGFVRYDDAVRIITDTKDLRNAKDYFKRLVEWEDIREDRCSEWFEVQGLDGFEDDNRVFKLDMVMFWMVKWSEFKRRPLDTNARKFDRQIGPDGKIQRKKRGRPKTTREGLLRESARKMREVLGE